VNGEIAPGVKTGGGVVQIAMNELDIQCLPDDLPEFIEVDLKEMELNETLHATEIAMPKGVEPVAKLKHENPSVVSVHVPKEIVIEEEAAAPVTEIIGEVPAEGEEGAEAAEGGEKKEGAAAGGDKKEPAAEKKEPAKKGKE
jgi:large subunit ribosomal protein L25